MGALSAPHLHPPHNYAQPGLIHFEIAKVSGLCADLAGCTSRANLCNQHSFLKGLAHIHAFSESKIARKTPSVMFWGYYTLIRH